MTARFLLVLCLVFSTAAQTTTDSSKPAVTAGTTTEVGVTDPLVAAQALLRKGKFEEAATAFKSIVAGNPSSAEAQVGLVQSLLRARQLDEAEEAGKKAVAAFPSSAAVHATVGDVAFRAGKFGDAEAEYRAALKLDDNSARGTFGMARMMEMVSLRKSARAAFAKAHEFDPHDKQISDSWVGSLSYAEQLAVVTRAAGEHPTEREAERIKFLSAVAKKKPWVLASELKPAEIKMLQYGRSFAAVSTGDKEGAAPIAKGYALDVKFNDQASALLLLDTGAGGVVLGRKLAEKAGVVKIADSYLFGVGDQGAIQGYLGWVDKIKIGSVEFHNCIVHVSSRNDVADDSGLVGANIFEKFLVTLDFKEWKLLLSPLPQNPGSGVEDDEPQDRYIAPEMQSYTKIFRFGHDLVIPVIVSDKAAGNFIIDSGAGFNSVSPKLARQITKLNYEGYSVRGVSGSVKEVLNGDKAILQFAKIRVRSDDIPVFSIDNLSNAEGTEIAGFIGIKTLVQTKLSIDYRDGLVNFEVYDFKKARE